MLYKITRHSWRTRGRCLCWWTTLGWGLSTHWVLWGTPRLGPEISHVKLHWRPSALVWDINSQHNCWNTNALLWSVKSDKNIVIRIKIYFVSVPAAVNPNSFQVNFPSNGPHFKLTWAKPTHFPGEDLIYLVTLRDQLRYRVLEAVNTTSK